MFSGSPSLADIAAVTRNNGDGGFGNGEGWWVLIILFALFGGWGGNGYYGGNGNQGALTRGDLCMDMNFNDLQNAVRSGAAENNANFRTIDNAICTLGYQNAQLINGIDMSIAQGFNATTMAIMQGQNALSSQIASCCCENREAICDLKYQTATNTRDIIDANNANTRAILDTINANYTRDLENRLQKAEWAASQTAQNEYLVSQLRPCPVPAYVTCNPWANQAAYGSCGSCGCN